MRRAVSTGFIIASLMAGTIIPASASDPIRLTIKDHRFSPDKITVPTGERLRLEITNQDATPEEFESSDLRVEKIIVPGGKITVIVGPLKPRDYKFFGEYHSDTASGILTAVDPATGN